MLLAERRRPGGSDQRNAVYQAERRERAGAITLKQMQKLAEAMGGRFVYAVGPEGSVGDVIRAQVVRKAEDLAEELAREVPPDFWRMP